MPSYRDKLDDLFIEKLGYEFTGEALAIPDIEGNENNAVAAREGAFKPLCKLITRVINALKAADTSPETDEKAKTLVRKLQGRRASSKLTEEEKQELIAYSGAS